MKNESGSAYVFVLVILLTVFSMLGVSLAVSSSQAKITSAYGKYSGLYSMAVSGADEAMRIINAEISASIGSALAEAANSLKRSGVISQSLIYVSDGSNPYAGVFRLRADVRKQVFEDVTKACFVKALDAFEKRLGAYMLEYTIKIKDESFNILTVITESGGNYALSSTATRIQGGQEHTVRADITIAPMRYEEEIIPVYCWKIGGADAIDSALNPYSEFLPDPVLFAAGYTEQNPVFVAPDGGSVDVSLFTVPSVIINPSNTELDIYSSSGLGFTGIIISEGDVTLRDLRFAGAVFSRSDVFAVGCELVFDSEMPFMIGMTDAELQKRLFDMLGITSFSSGGSDVGGMLGALSINGFSVALRGAEGHVAVLRGLKSVK